MHGLATGGPIRVTKTAGRKHLCQLFRSMGFSYGAEIGVWEGKFSDQICLANEGVQLLCVDPWAPYAAYREKKNDKERLDSAYRETQARLAPYNCTIVRKTSTAAARDVADRSLDFIYLDANHEEPFVRDDLAVWAQKVRSSGVVAGHDYGVNPRKSFIQVKPAVDAFVQAHGIAPLYVLAAEKSNSFFWIQP